MNGVGYNTAVCRIKHSVQYTWVWGPGAMGLGARCNGGSGLGAMGLRGLGGMGAGAICYAGMVCNIGPSEPKKLRLK